MRYRFGNFLLDEDARELRLGDREIVLQPLVFDLLRYLVERRDRVVTKQELLDNLWDDALVVDGALQRAVSLARSALRAGRAEGAIRTHARRGYRFCEDVLVEPAPTPDSNHLARARAAFENKDWETAIEAFAAADVAREIGGADLERWARALQCLARSGEAVVPLERAVATYAVENDRRGSARAALSMAYVMVERRDATVAKGWHKRAERYLQGLEPCDEHAMHALLAGRLALYESDNERALERSNQTIELARHLGNADLEAMGLVYSGHALMALGDIDGGAARHDEAIAAVLAGEINPWFMGIVYCGVIWACRNLGDWKRATAWTEQFTRWCRTRPGSRFPTTCQLHRAEVMAVGGDLRGAEPEITSALALLTVNAPWAEGEAHRIRGGLLLLRGDLEGAACAIALAIEQGWDPQPEYALLHAARNDTALAVRSLERSIADTNWLNRERLPELLSQLITLAARGGDAARARAALAELEGMSETFALPAQRAALESARAEVAAMEGRRQPALASLRRALRLWEDIGAPVKATATRLRVAELLLEDADPVAARKELSAASRSAHALALEPLIDACIALQERCEPGQP